MEAPGNPVGGVDFGGLSKAELESMLEAGGVVVECFRALAKTDDNVVGELLRGVESFYEWNHYPDGDVYDSETHSQFYFHAHPEEDRAGEHGHFHTFIRPAGMPADIQPAPVADYTPPEDPDDALSHLVAISMDNTGFPIRFFTTNRWVTGEIWYRAEDVCRLIELFQVDHTQPSWPVNLWVTNMIALFRPQVRQLLLARDAAVEAWAEANPGENVYEARELEVTSELPIDIDAQIAAVNKALAAQG